MPTTTACDRERSTLRRQVALCFLVAYALPWSVWLTRVGDEHGWLSWHLPTGIALWVMLPGTLAVAAVTGGRAAVRDLLRAVGHWRVGTRWYLAALGVPVALAVAATALFRAAGGANQIGSVLSASAAASYFLLGVAMFTLTEEMTWRGFALPRLQRLMPALPASLMLGAVWAVWHVPTFVLPSETVSTLPYVGFAVFVVAQSVLTTWLYNRTGGSVLIVGVFHAASDAVYSYTGAVGGDNRLFWILVVLGCAAAVAVTRLEGPATLAGRRAAPVLPERHPVEQTSASLVG